MKKLRAAAVGLVAALLLVVIGGPFVYVLVLSFFTEGSAFSAEGYYRVFLGSQEYLLNFWRSLFLCAVIVAGQVVLSVFAGLGFAKYAFPGKNFWFFLLLVVMVLPLPGDAGAKLPHSGGFGPAGYPVGLGAARHVRAPGHLPHDPMLPLGAR